MGIIEYLVEEEVQKRMVKFQKRELKFQKGKDEEVEKKNRQFVVNLLKGTDHSIAKIASLAGVSVYYVKKVKSTLRKKTSRQPK